MPENTPYLTVAIAAFNEEHRLPQALDRALGMLTTRPQTFEVIVCDDGSTDRTVEVVQDYAHRSVRLVRLRRNRGKGAAVRAAVLASRGEYVLFSDADFSTPITELPRVLQPLEAGEAEITIGSRHQADGTDMRASQPRYRRAFGKLFHTLAALIAVRGIGDTQAGVQGSAWRRCPRAVRTPEAREHRLRRGAALPRPTERLPGARGASPVDERRWLTDARDASSRRAGTVGLAPYPLAAPRRAPDARLTPSGLTPAPPIVPRRAGGRGHGRP